MRLIDYIFLANKNLSRRKKSVIVNSILIVISTVIFILGLSFTKCFMNSINRAILKNPSYRTIVLTGVKEEEQDSVIKRIEEDKNIEKVLKNKEYVTSANLKTIDNINIGKYVSLNGANENIAPQVVAGRKIRDNDVNVCIIPKKVFFYSGKEDFNKDDYIDGESLIGKKISLEYHSRDDSKGSLYSEINKTFLLELEIIGVYNADEYVMDGNDFFVPFSTISKIENDREENWIKDPNTSYAGSNMIYAIVNNALNLDESFEKIASLGYRSIIRSTTNTAIIIVINTVVGIVVGVFLLIVLVNIASSTIKSIDERKYEIGMLKAIGYKNRNIQKLFLIENVIIGARAYLIGLIIAIISMFIMQTSIFEKNYDFYLLNIRTDIAICIIAGITMIIVPTLATLFSSKTIYKKTAISLSKER